MNSDKENEPLEETEEAQDENSDKIVVGLGFLVLSGIIWFHISFVTSAPFVYCKHCGINGGKGLIPSNLAEKAFAVFVEPFMMGIFASIGLYYLWGTLLTLLAKKFKKLKIDINA